MKKTYLPVLFFAVLIFSCHLDKFNDPADNCQNPPTASFSVEGGGADCPAPCTVTFINSSTNATSYKLNFGDGDSTSFNAGNIAHVYANAGVYSVSLIALGDADCPSNTATKQITVTSVACPHPPAAILSVQGGGTDCEAPCTVTFINGSTNAINYRLTFGDGDTTDFTTGNITHIYQNAGLYSASLTAFGDPDCSPSVTTRQITVAQAGIAPVVAFTFNLDNNGGYAPCNVAFINNSTNGTSYSWDFGDNSPPSTELAPHHTYACPGDYVVTLTVSNNFGSNSITKIVNIAALTFSTEYGDPTPFEVGLCVKQTMDGGYIVAGLASFNQGDSATVLLVRFNAQGELVWKDSDLGYAFNPAIATSVVQLSDGSFVVLLDAEDEARLVKLSGFGFPWAIAYDLGSTTGEVSNSLIQLQDGGFAFVGSKDVSGNEGNIYVVKTNASGQLVSEKVFGGNGFDSGKSMQQTADQGFIITGEMADQNGDRTAFLLKTDAQLNQEWLELYPGLGVSVGQCVQTTADGGYVVAGSSSANKSENGNIFLFKTNATGQLSFQQYFNGSAPYLLTGAYSVLETEDGGFLLGTNESNAYILKTNSQGALEFSRSGNTSFHMQRTNDCGYILTGGKQLGLDDINLLLKKVDQEGN